MARRAGSGSRSPANVVPMLVLNAGVVGGPCLVVDAWPRTTHYFTAVGTGTGS